VQLGGEWRSPTELHLRLSIAPGYHVNAHEPGGGAVPLVPTRVVVEGAGPASTVDYPPGDASSSPSRPNPFACTAAR
jgi:hypothetical protein